MGLKFRNPPFLNHKIFNAIPVNYKEDSIPTKLTELPFLVNGPENCPPEISNKNLLLCEPLFFKTSETIPFKHSSCP